jgi:hypothetical protein
MLYDEMVESSPTRIDTATLSTSSPFITCALRNCFDKFDAPIKAPIFLHSLLQVVTPNLVSLRQILSSSLSILPF